MAKSMNKRIAAYQRNKSDPKDNGKRGNHNRAKHGCRRLHAMRNREHTPIEPEKTTLIGKIKNMWKR